MDGNSSATYAAIVTTIPISAKREATTLVGEIVQPVGPPMEVRTVKKPSSELFTERQVYDIDIVLVGKKESIDNDCRGA